MARGAPLIPLGYGKFVRADKVYALVPLQGDARGDGHRTQVHVEGLEDPIIASRSEQAIARDVMIALGQDPDEQKRRREPAFPGQEHLF